MRSFDSLDAQRGHQSSWGGTGTACAAVMWDRPRAVEDDTGSSSSKGGALALVLRELCPIARLNSSA